MIKRGTRHIFTTWLAGLLVLLPLALTLALLAWVVNLLNTLIGPGTFVGRGLAALGYTVSENDKLAYLLGTLILLAAIYLLGLAVQKGLRRPLAALIETLFDRIPLFGKLYRFAEKLVALVDRRPDQELAGMEAVWCFFGGKGAAVLALAPNAEPIEIDGRSYLGVLVPTAPVPIGGALLYVPTDWVKPANLGIEKVTAVYVSMGLTPPLAAPPPARG